MCCLLCTVVLVFAQETTTDSTYKEALQSMFELSGSDKTYQAAIDQMFVMFKQQYTNVNVDTWSELQKEFSQTSIADLTQMLTPIYREHLSLEDIQGIIQFYKTPAGMKFAEKTPFIVQESIQVGQQWGMQIGEKFAQRMKEKGY